MTSKSKSKDRSRSVKSADPNKDSVNSEIPLSISETTIPTIQPLPPSDSSSPQATDDLIVTSLNRISKLLETVYRTNENLVSRVIALEEAKKPPEGGEEVPFI